MQEKNGYLHFNFIERQKIKHAKFTSINLSNFIRNCKPVTLAALVWILVFNKHETYLPIDIFETLQKRDCQRDEKSTAQSIAKKPQG